MALDCGKAIELFVLFPVAGWDLIQRVRWNKITLIGMGLLGGSLGLAIRRHRLARQVAGYARRSATVRQCRAKRVVHVATMDLAEAVQNADLIILCTPIAQMRSLLESMLPHVRAGAVITDVGSVKQAVVNQLEPLARQAGAHFIGSHPMAGSEKTGVKAAKAGLYKNRICVVTPTPVSHPGSLRRVRQFWKSVGSRVMEFDPTVHDALACRGSHLPHILAASLVRLVLGAGGLDGQERLCATGFRDSTRIASGSPEMWRDIALANREFLDKALEEFGVLVGQFRALLTRQDSEGIQKFLAEAKALRDEWLQKQPSMSEE